MLYDNLWVTEKTKEEIMEIIDSNDSGRHSGRNSAIEV